MRICATCMRVKEDVDFDGTGLTCTDCSAAPASSVGSDLEARPIPGFDAFVVKPLISPQECAVIVADAS